jgi:hypothetical protein
MPTRGNTKRWGPPFEDRRDWPTYNETLVQRGEFYLELDFFFQWAAELERINQGKEGGRYEYPESFAQYLACVKIGRRFDYRGLEGFTRKLIQEVKPALAAHGMSRPHLDLLKAPDYSTLQRRITHAKLDPKTISLLQEGKEYYVALDSSGLRVTNRGEWLRRKYGHRGQKSRGWIRVHIGVTTQTDQTSGIRVTQEAVGDAKSGESLLRESANRAEDADAKLTKAYGDGGYDAKRMFNAAHERGVEPVFKIRSNASSNAHGSRERKRRVQEYQSLGYKDWAAHKRYGLRWKACEGKFSSVKRMFGDYATSHKWVNMQNEVRTRFLLHDALLAYTAKGLLPWNQP